MSQCAQESGKSYADEIEREPNAAKRLLKILGPGLVTGASDDDPAGIATYASAGAAFGFGLLWTALLTFPLMATVQYICAKIALVSGQGITSLLRQNTSRPILWTVVFVLVVANTINLGVDIGAVAAGVNLLTGLPIYWLCPPLAIILIAFQIWCCYRTIASLFKWFTLALFAYIASAFLSRPDWFTVLKHTFIPHIQFDSSYFAMLVAILGTTISPYLFFWQANQEIEEEKMHGRKRLWQRRGATDKELEYAALDVNVGMAFSNIVMYFIILSTAATLHAAGQTKIDTAAQAAVALKPFAGAAAEILMAVGLIGCGLLAIPVLAASNAYAVAEALQIKMGLNEKPRRARGFYAMIVVSTLVGMAINYVGINPIKALVWASILNGFLAPPLLVVIMLISSNRKIMGTRVNSLGINILGWSTAALMTAAAVGLLLT